MGGCYVGRRNTSFGNLVISRRIYDRSGEFRVYWAAGYIKREYWRVQRREPRVFHISPGSFKWADETSAIVYSPAVIHSLETDGMIRGPLHCLPENW